MKRTVKWVLILGVVLGGGGYGIARMKAKQAEPKTAAYSSQVVERRDLVSTVESTGQVEPRNRLKVMPPISGRIEELLLDEGDAVRKGQIIGWISSTERAALLDAALAAGPEELAYWQEIYKPTPLIAPLDGTIIARNFEPGQSITASDAVVVIADDLIVVANLDETDIGLIVIGQKVMARLEAYPDQQFICSVEKIAYDAMKISSVTMYQVDVHPESIPVFARSGMTTELEFVISEKFDVLAIPVAAMQPSSGSETGGVTRATVLVGSIDAPRSKPVVLGGRYGIYMEVLEGLSEGESVLIPGVAMNQDTGPSGNPFMPKKRSSKKGN